jgi:fructan beta-fructosidase
MTLATKDRVTFYSSPDLKSWKKESEFGKDLGAHDGVWECPNLFPMTSDGKTYWVLLVSVNPGAPNGGSGTQYFIGQFDGKKFTAHNPPAKWVDYGPDDYAGITWNNTGARKVFLGWMSNWIYANQVPTATWRNAMTIPRDIKLTRVGEELYLSSLPVKELNQLSARPVSLDDVEVDTMTDLTDRLQASGAQFKLELHADSLKDFYIRFFNSHEQQMILGYERSNNRWYIDRALSGKTDFNASFAKSFFAPKIAKGKALDLTVIMDASSMEVFADNGLTVMTAIFFPDTPLTRIQVGSRERWTIKNVRYTPLRSIW